MEHTQGVIDIIIAGVQFPSPLQAFPNITGFAQSPEIILAHEFPPVFNHPSYGQGEVGAGVLGILLNFFLCPNLSILYGLQ